MPAPAHWKISEVSIDNLLATDEICYETGISRHFIWEMVKRGKVPAVQRYMNEEKQYGKQYYFDERSIPILLKLADEYDGKKGMPPVRANEIVDDEIVDEITGEAPTTRGRPRTIRYARITPGFMRALAGYLGLKSAADLVDVIGYPSRWYLNRWFQDYHPSAYRGWTVGLQASVFWYAKLLYKAGVIPYSLARLGGIFDYAAHKRETALLRRLERYGFGNAASLSREKVRNAKGDGNLPSPTKKAKTSNRALREGHGAEGGADEGQGL